MKPIFVLAFFVLAISQTFGFYLQNSGHASGCGCGGSIVNIPLDQLPVAGQQPGEDDGTRYKFDFGVQQPRASDTQPQLNSYGYQIQEPSEPQTEDTKYKYDYTLQQPMDAKVAETPNPTLNTKIDRMIQDKPVCTCTPGSPCTCGMTNDNAYVLPVRYNNGGDYVVYELPQEESTRYLHRCTRQASTPPGAPAIVDRIRATAERIRGHAARMITTNGGSDRVGAVLGATSDADQSGSRTTPPINVGALRDRFSSLAEPIVGIIKESFATARSKRDTMDVDRRSSETEMPMPTLRVKEYNPSNDQTRYSKYINTNTARVELQTPKHHEMDIKEMEKASHCHSCGTKLMNSVCSRCGTYQPQYIEFIEGKQVAFYPGAIQESQQQQQQPIPDGTEATRFIFDRYGHKYLENNGKLRLVRNQPDYAGLAEILNQKENRDVMQQLNQSPGRLMPQPVDIVSDLTKLVRELARNPRNVPNDSNADGKNQEVQSTTMTMGNAPRSMYQIVPMQYDGKNGKLAVKIYDNKREMNTATDPKPDETTAEDWTNNMEKAPAFVKKFVKNNKEFEILSFSDYKGTDDDDIRRVLEHLHGKQQW